MSKTLINFTGDLHGGLTSYHVTSARFKPAKRGDIVICTGDFGGVWRPDYATNERHRRDEDYFLESRLRQRVLWLAVDGNHENFDRLFGGEFPLVDLFGGKAYQIRKNVYYLRRGDVFTIEGQTFFAFGGARSHDKDPGWVPSASSAYGMGGIYGHGKKEWNKGRTEGVDWFAQEIPSREDYDRAVGNLDRVGWKVDHVVTHTLPVSMRACFQTSGPYQRAEDPTEAMLQGLWDGGLEFGYWHFGHYHQEKQVDRFVCHYDEVRPITDYQRSQEAYEALFAEK